MYSDYNQPLYHVSNSNSTAKFSYVMLYSVLTIYVCLDNLDNLVN